MFTLSLRGSVAHSHSHSQASRRRRTVSKGRKNSDGRWGSDTNAGILSALRPPQITCNHAAPPLPVLAQKAAHPLPQLPDASHRIHTLFKPVSEHHPLFLPCPPSSPLLQGRPLRSLWAQPCETGGSGSWHLTSSRRGGGALEKERSPGCLLEHPDSNISSISARFCSMTLMQVNDPYTAVVLKAFLETLFDAGVMARGRPPLSTPNKHLPFSASPLPSYPPLMSGWHCGLFLRRQVVTTANKEPADLDAGVAQQKELFLEFLEALKVSTA